MLPQCQDRERPFRAFRRPRMKAEKKRPSFPLQVPKGPRGPRKSNRIDRTLSRRREGSQTGSFRRESALIARLCRVRRFQVIERVGRRLLGRQTNRSRIVKRPLGARVKLGPARRYNRVQGRDTHGRGGGRHHCWAAAQAEIEWAWRRQRNRGSRQMARMDRLRRRRVRVAGINGRRAGVLGRG